MTSGVETEVKLALRDRGAFDRLRAALPAPTRVVDQLNVYLDTDDGRLADAKATLRLRVTAAEAWLTFKQRSRSEGATFRAVEREVAVDRAWAVATVRAGRVRDLPRAPELAEAALRAGTRDLRPRTWSRTVREVRDLGDGFAAELDETAYPDGTVDFEVEVEHEDPVEAQRRIEAVAAAAGVELQAQGRTKHARARARSGRRPPPIPGEEPAAAPGGARADEGAAPGRGDGAGQGVAPGAGGMPGLAGAAVAALAIGVACIAVLPGSIYWLDAPEFATAAWNLGQAHPPGHPVLAMLLKAFLLLPAGDAPFRANLFSATWGAAAALLAGLLAGEAATRAGARGGWVQAAAAAGALGLGASGSGVLQAVSVEVYTFNAALTLAALLLAVRGPGDARAGASIAVLLGLGLANHHFLTVLAAPGIAAAWLRRRPAGAAVGAALVVGLVVTAASYAYLAVRAAAGAWPEWADTSDPAALWWVVSARVFTASLGGFEADSGGIAGNLGRAAGLLAGSLGWPLLLLAVAGLALLAARTRGIALSLALFVAGSLASKVVMGILDPQNPDDHGYFLGATAGLAVLASAAAGALGSRAAARPAGSVRAAALAGCVAAWAMVGLVPAAAGAGVAEDRATFSDTASLGRRLWEEQPPRAVLLLSHYPVFFLAQYQAAVEGVRPDVTLVQESLYAKARGGAFYARRIAGDDPDLAPLAAAFIERGTLDWAAVRELAARRPVRLEASPDLDVPLSDVRWAGWTFAVGGGTVADDEQELAALRRVVPDGSACDLETRRVLMRNLSASAEWLSRQGAQGAALRLLQAARELNPADRTLAARVHDLQGALQGRPEGAL